LVQYSYFMIPTREEIDKADEEDNVSLCRELCERLLRENPDDAPLLYLYANKLMKFALYEEAERVLFHAEKVAPAPSIKWILSLRGRLYEERGDYHSAEEVFLRSHSLDPKEAAFLIFAASVVFRSGDIPRAISLITQATLCDDDLLYEAQFNLGGYLCAQRRYAEALNCYRRVMELRPDYGNVQVRLADVERVLAFQHRESVDIRLLPSP
jgi:tetratricopeptide (TPR) repeat protein